MVSLRPRGPVAQPSALRMAAGWNYPEPVVPASSCRWPRAASWNLDCHFDERTVADHTAQAFAYGSTSTGKPLYGTAAGPDRAAMRQGQHGGCDPVMGSTFASDRDHRSIARDGRRHPMSDRVDPTLCVDATPLSRSWFRLTRRLRCAQHIPRHECSNVERLRRGDEARRSEGRALIGGVADAGFMRAARLARSR